MIHIVAAAVGYDVENSSFIKSLEANPAGLSPGLKVALITEVHKYEPHIERLFIAQEYVRQLPAQTKVILSDFRDVLFQGDLAALDFNKPGIYFESALYKNEPYNTHWITRDYGPHFYESIKNRPITCCGVVTGKKEFVEDYLGWCCREIDRLPEVLHGADTSVHAKYVYDRGLTYYRDNERSPVYTVGLVDGVIFNRGQIVNKAGDVPLIVHQYDRHIPWCLS